MKLNVLLIGVFVITILIVSSFAYISAVIDNNKNIEIFRAHYQSHDEDYGEELSQIEANIFTKLRLILIVFTIVSIILSVFVGFVLNHIIGRPIIKLSKAVDEVSKGNFDVEVNTQTGIKEINILAESLNRVMTTMKLAILRKGAVKSKQKSTKGISEQALARAGLIGGGAKTKKVSLMSLFRK